MGCECAQSSLCATSGMSTDSVSFERVAAEAGAAVKPALSRKAQKKLAKQQLSREKLLQRRAAKKQSSKAASAKKREETAQFLAQLSEEELRKLREESRARREKRKQDADLHKQKLKDAMQSGPRIVIDLDFDEKMTEKEVKSLCQQIAYSYSANAKAENPAHLHLTSLKGRIKDTLGRHASGFTAWLTSQDEESYEQLFADRKADLVYLTADAQETLEELDPQKIYIIGGIVDRNRHKRLCQAKAEAQQIASARLPLEQHMKLAGTRILTVNQACEIMLHWMATKDWGVAAERVVPVRKQAKAEEELEPEREPTPVPDAPSDCQASDAEAENSLRQEISAACQSPPP